MSKLSSYQKLKTERDKMGLDLLELINHPDSAKSTEIRLRYSMMQRIEQLVWDGNVRNGNTCFIGLVNMRKS